MISKCQVTRHGILPAMVVAAIAFGCGGGAHAPSVTPPPISVSLSTAVATVQVGGTAKLTATVTNDSSSSGVAWVVSCSATECGEISPGQTTSGMATTYTAPSSVPSNNLTITVTATSVADTSKSSSAKIIPVGHIPGYDVGVDYEAYGTDLNSTAFITIYNQPQVRQTVQAQLQGMADRGAAFITTNIWFTFLPGAVVVGTGGTHFPMSDQEAANLRAYAQDVAAVQGAGGNRLRLNLTLSWVGDGDYSIGSPTTGLGTSNLPAAEFISSVQTCIDKVLTAVNGVARPDGVLAVDTVFLVGEPAIQAPGELAGTPNAGWFLTTNYPHLVSGATKVGVRPSIYFSGDCRELAVLDDTYIDAYFPILNGHRSMFWVYRGLKFMADNGLPLPTGHIDFDCYMDPPDAPYDQLLQRILDDADAVLPSLGAAKFYYMPETYYMADPNLRLQYGRVFPAQAAQNPRMQRVSFWGTEGGGINNEELNTTYPFSIEDFLPPPTP